MKWNRWKAKEGNACKAHSTLPGTRSALVCCKNCFEKITP